MLKSSVHRLRTALRLFASDAGGATAIEYAIIAAGISIAIVATVAALGSNVQGFYNSVSNAMSP